MPKRQKNTIRPNKRVNIRVLLLVIGLSFSAFAEDSIPPYREVSTELAQELQEDSDFEYKLHVPSEQMGLSDLLQRRIQEFLRGLWSGLGSDAGRALVYGLGAFLILYVLYRLMGPDRIGLATNKEIRNSDEFKHWEKSVESLESLLLRAEQNSDWREFIRLQFLMGLKTMDAAGYLKLSPKKTALDYSYEIKDRDLAQQFLHFSRTFEYVWYGGFEANKSRALNYRREFRKLPER